MEPGQLSEDRAGRQLSVAKLDLYRQLKAEYVTPKQPAPRRYDTRQVPDRRGTR
jgi:hypothetical protein